MRKEIELEVAATILMQLGGRRFIAMTGSKDFVGTEDSLLMTLSRNKSGANRLKITLDFGTDTYSVRFYKYLPMRFDHKRGDFITPKEKDIYTLDEVYWDMLQEIFTDVTGLDTHL